MSVKNKKRGRPSKTGKTLSAEAVVKSAVGLLRQSGKVPSIRQIACALNVDPMAIYYYYPNKATLLEAVAVDLMESIYEPDGYESWQTELMYLCDSYLELLRDHAGLLDTMLSMSSFGPAQIFNSRFHTIISPLKLATSDMKDALDLLVDYLHGFVLSVRCNKGECPPTVDMTRGPIKLVINALEGKSLK